MAAILFSSPWPQQANSSHFTQCVILRTFGTKFTVSPKLPKYIREESSVNTHLAQIAEITVTLP
jgi:hypothetical protein